MFYSQGSMCSFWKGDCRCGDLVASDRKNLLLFSLRFARVHIYEDHKQTTVEMACLHYLLVTLFDSISVKKCWTENSNYLLAVILECVYSRDIQGR